MFTDTAIRAQLNADLWPSCSQARHTSLRTVWKRCCCHV